MKTVPLALILLAAGALTTGCGTSSEGSGSSSATSLPSFPTLASTPVAGSSTAAPAATGTSGSTGSRSGSAGSGSTGMTTCRAANLKASVGGGTGAGASNDHIGLNLRNAGPVSCTLYGYPGVSWVAGADGRQVGDAATRVPDSTGSREKTVTLAPGAVASAPLDIVQAAAIGTGQQCEPVPVRGLRVYPPGEKAALFLSLPTGSGGYGECSAKTSTSTLNVGWMQPGTQPDS